MDVLSVGSKVFAEVQTQHCISGVICPGFCYNYLVEQPEGHQDSNILWQPIRGQYDQQHYLKLSTLHDLDQIINPEWIALQ